MYEKLYDIVLCRQELLTMKDEKIIEMLNKIYPKKKIYKISHDWRNSCRFILKAKGVYGDILAGWKDRGAVLY